MMLKLTPFPFRIHSRHVRRGKCSDALSHAQKVLGLNIEENKILTISQTEILDKRTKEINAMTRSVVRMKTNKRREEAVGISFIMRPARKGIL